MLFMGRIEVLGLGGADAGLRAVLDAIYGGVDEVYI